MIIESLGKLWYGNARCFHGFLLSMKSELKDIKNKKIVILGCGQEGYVLSNLLKNLGVEIYAYVDNSLRIQDKQFGNIKIASPYDYFDSDVYIIAAVVPKSIATVRLQFMTHHITDYSLFLIRNYNDIGDEYPELNELIYGALNTVCFKNETVESALPHIGFCSGQDTGSLGALDYLISSEEKIYPEFIWTYNFVNENKNIKALEIGPGLGFMSLVLLRASSDMQMKWINFGDPNSVFWNKNSVWDRGLRKIANEFENRVVGINGYIEMNDFEIEGKYDMIILTEVFEHFALNPLKTIEKIKNALTENGIIALSTPDWGHVPIWENWEKMPTCDEVSVNEYLQLTKCVHSYQYSKNELLDIFDRVGLKVKDYVRTEVGVHNFLLSLNE